MKLTENAKSVIRWTKITDVGEHHIDLDNGLTLYLSDDEVMQLNLMYPDNKTLDYAHRRAALKNKCTIIRTISMGDGWIMSATTKGKNGNNILHTEVDGVDVTNDWSWADPKNCGWFDTE